MIIAAISVAIPVCKFSILYALAGLICYGLQPAGVHCNILLQLLQHDLKWKISYLVWHGYVMVRTVDLQSGVRVFIPLDTWSFWSCNQEVECDSWLS